MTRGPAITMQVCVQARIYAFLDMVQGSLNLVVDLSVDGGSNVLHTVPLNDWDVEGEAPEEASSSAVQVFVHSLYPWRAPGVPLGASNPAHTWRSRGPLRRTKSSRTRCTRHACSPSANVDSPSCACLRCGRTVGT